MKTAVVLFAAAAIALGTMGAFQPPSELEIGSVAPKTDLKMRDVSGKDLTLADVKGEKGLLVIFSCNTCPFVHAWENRYKPLFGKCADMGVGMVLVNSNEAKRSGGDSYDAMQERAKDKAYPCPYVVDAGSVLADAFGANRTPECFLFDASMHLVYRGAIDDNYEDATQVKQFYVADALDAMLGGREVAVKTTKSVGCTIKRL